jgi:hypothetical protein
MKVTTFVRTSLAGIACMGFMLGVAVGAPTESKVKSKDSTQKSQLRSTAVKPRVIWVYVTDSRIPQRVVVRGQQVDSASPIYVVQGEQLSRNGATSVYGMLALDPSISRSGRSH